MRWLWLVVLAGCGLWEVPEVSDVPPIDTVAVQVVRFDTGGLVSTGVPLRPGLLRDADSVRLMIDGAEVPMYVEPLAGRHADGSYRSMLVQFPWAGDSAQGVLEFGVLGVRQGEAVPVTWTVEPAVLLPSSPAYIVSTGVLPPMVPSLAPHPLARALDSIQFRWMRHHLPRIDATNAWWVREGNFYDAVFATYALWARTGDIDAWRQATRLARLYTAVRPMQSWLFNPDGLYANYLLTGDLRSRAFLAEWADHAFRWRQPNVVRHWGTGPEREGREQQRPMLAALYAGMLEHKPEYWLPMVDQWVTAWMDTQEPHFAAAQDSLTVDGAWHYPLGTGVNGQSNFMEGLRVSAMITYLELRTPSLDVRQAVERSIQRQVDYLWTTQWNASALSFNYHSSEYRGVAFPDTLTQAQINQRTLNNLMALGFAYTYHATGDTVYRDRAVQVMTPAFALPGWTPWYAGSPGKEFNQNYYSSWRALYYVTVPPRLDR
jgi:hypothetical protein